MQETWTWIQENLFPHWPFIVYLLFTTVVAQITKNKVFTKDLAAKSTVVFWLRRLMPLILIVLGLVTGLLWPGETSPGVSETMHKTWYFMGAACVSIAGYSAARNYAKKKYDIDISIGQDSSPPDPKKS